MNISFCVQCLFFVVFFVDYCISCFDEVSLIPSVYNRALIWNPVARFVFLPFEVAKKLKSKES